MAAVEIIGVPLDLGADRRGVDMGPSAIRYAGLSDKLRELGHRVHDSGNVSTPIAEESRVEYSNAKYLGEVIRCLRKISTDIELAVHEKCNPSILFTNGS